METISRRKKNSWHEISEWNDYEDNDNCNKSDDEVSCTSSEIRDIDECTNSRTLPVKSREKYETVYLTYSNWKKSKKIKLTSENVLKAYFVELSEKYAPPTLLRELSILKSTLYQKDGIDIGRYNQLTAFLKTKLDGYKSKRSKVLSAKEVKRFLKEAPDDKYLAAKVSLVFGICGGCSRDELAYLKVKNVKRQGNIVVVKIPDAKTKMPRTFMIEGEFERIVRKYVALRPPNSTSDRFFLSFENGICKNKVMGKNKFSSMPKEIAEYLNLSDPSLYTVHSFRRISAVLLVNSGAESTIPESHEDPIDSEQKTGYTILSSMPVASSTSKQMEELRTSPLNQSIAVNVPKTENIEDISNTTININSDTPHPPFQFVNCNVNIHYH